MIAISSWDWPDRLSASTAVDTLRLLTARLILVHRGADRRLALP